MANNTIYLFESISDLNDHIIPLYNNNSKSIFIFPSSYYSNYIDNKILISSPEKIDGSRLFTFDSLITKYFEKIVPGKKCISKIIKQLIIEKLIKDNFKSCNTLTNGEKSRIQSLSPLFIDIFNEIKNSLKLNNNINFQNNPKQREILNLFHKYNDFLEENKIYDNDTIIWEVINNINVIEENSFIFANFYDFQTPQFIFIEELIKLNKEVHLLLPDANKPDFTGLRLNKMINLLTENYNFNTQNYKTTYPFQYLEKSIYHERIDLENKEPPRTTIITGAGIYEEIKNISDYIRGQVKDSPEKFCDYAIVVKDEEYVQYIEDIFRDNNIPYNQHILSRLNETIFSVYLINILRSRLDNFVPPAIISIIESPFFNKCSSEKKNDIKEIIYLLPFTSGPGNWKKNFDIYKKNKLAEINNNNNPGLTKLVETKMETFEECVNIIEDLIINPINNLKNMDTINGFIKTIYNIIRNFKVDKAVQNILDNDINLFNYTGQIKTEIDALFETIEELENTTSIITEKYKLEDFIELLNKMLKQSTVIYKRDIYPAVDILSVEDTKLFSFKRLIITGLHDGKYPQVFPEDPVLNDNERENIAKNLNSSLLFNSKMKIGILMEHFIFRKLLTTTTEELILSYHPITSDGNETVKSIFVEMAEKKLKDTGIINIPFQKQKFLEYPDSYNHIYNETCLLIEDSINDEYTEQFTIYTRFDNIRRLSNIESDEDIKIAKTFEEHFGIIKHIPDYILSKISMSPSAIENYLDCQFRFFLQNILEIDHLQIPDMEIKDTSIGLFYHEVLSKWGNKKWDKSKFNKIFDSIFNNYIINEKVSFPELFEMEKYRHKNILSHYIRKENISKEFKNNKIIETEFPIANARLDRIDKNIDNEFIISDYKTGYRARINLNKKNANNILFQPYIYSKLYAKHQKLSYLPSFYYLFLRYPYYKSDESFFLKINFETTYGIPPTNKDKEQQLIDIENSIKTGIFSSFMNIFPINPEMKELKNKCRYCTYKLPCRRNAGLDA